MEITNFLDFFTEEEDFTKQDLLDLIDEFDEEEFEEFIEYLIDNLEDDEEDEESEEETELSREDIKAFINILDDLALQSATEYAISLVGDYSEEETDGLDEAMSSTAKRKAAIKRKKPAHKKAMRKLQKCRKAHSNLNDMKACGTDGKVHTKRNKSKRKKTSMKRKKLKNRITVK